MKTVKEGQKVRVKNFKYPKGPEHWVREMFAYAGKVVTISKFINDHHVQIEEDKATGWGWAWEPSDFEHAGATFLPKELFDI